MKNALAVGTLLATTLAAAAETPSYTVAYASFGPINSAIYIADVDGSQERMLLSNPLSDRNPSLSIDGHWVLFSSRRHGSVDIYRARLDGTQLEQLTDDPAFDDQPTLSPDVKRVAFVSSRTGQADIWILDLASRKARNLTNHAGGDYRPAWSPDGQWLAFSSDRDSAGARASTPASAKTQFAPPQLTQLYVMRADGSGLRRLTNGDASVGSADWSRDGRRVVFYEASAPEWRRMNTDFGGDSSTATSQIVSIDIATGTRQVHSSGPGRKLSPKWIGADRIGYVRGAADEKRGVRERVNLESEGIAFSDGVKGPQGQYANVSWSSDGKRMVFHRSLPGQWPPFAKTFSRDRGFELVRTGIFPSYSPDGRTLMSNTAYAATFHNAVLHMNPDGSARRIVFDDALRNSVAPVWSPDGERIAFGLGKYNAGVREGAQGHIVIMNRDGRPLQTVTAGSGNNGFPSWSPDGKRIVFRARNNGAKGLVILDLATGKTFQLTDGSSSDNFPAWSPKGDSIVFTSDRDGDWELYSIRPDASGLTRLTNSPGNDAHASWSSDGKWIAFSSARAGFKDEMPIGEGGGQGAGDIFVMRFDGSDVRQLTDDACEEATPAFAPTRKEGSTP